MPDCLRRGTFALLLSISASAAMAEPPKAVVDTLCRPTFELKDQPLSAGTATCKSIATSGAPVVNERGEVVAVNIAGSRVAEGFNLAGISGNVVRKALESVK